MGEQSKCGLYLTKGSSDIFESLMEKQFESIRVQSISVVSAQELLESLGQNVTALQGRLFEIAD